jgi:hypothetical protein
MKRRNAILLGAVIVIAFGFVAIVLMSFVRAVRHAPLTQAEVETELNQIAAPQGAAVTQHNVTNKWAHGNVGDYYRADLSYDQIRAHYDVELARHGWKFQKQVPLTSWGKDMGESQTFYCKGDRTADIYFTGREQSRLGYRYALDISWGLYDCK